MKGHIAVLEKQPAQHFLKYCRPAINRVGAVLLRQFQPTASALYTFHKLVQEKGKREDTRHTSGVTE